LTVTRQMPLSDVAGSDGSTYTLQAIGGTQSASKLRPHLTREPNRSGETLSACNHPRLLRCRDDRQHHRQPHSFTQEVVDLDCGCDKCHSGDRTGTEATHMHAANWRNAVVAHRTNHYTAAATVPRKRDVLRHSVTAGSFSVDPSPSSRNPFQSSRGTHHLTVTATNASRWLT